MQVYLSPNEVFNFHEGNAKGLTYREITNPIRKRIKPIRVSRYATLLIQGLDGRLDNKIHMASTAWVMFPSNSSSVKEIGVRSCLIHLE